MLVRLIVTASLLLALSGCAGQEASGSAAATGPTLPVPTAASPASAGEAPAEAPSATPSAAPSATPSAGAGLLLEAGGLGVVEDETRIEHLPFGTDAGTVRNAITHLLGPLTTSPRADCEQGLRTSSRVRGFELLFRGSRFVGWTDTGAKGRHLTTGDGIGVGVTVRTLLHSGTEVTIGRFEGGPEGEWTSEPAGLYGRSTSVAPTGRVTVISSGENCLGD